MLPGFDARCFDDLANTATAALAAHEFWEASRSKTVIETMDLSDCVAAARTARNGLRVALAALIDAGLVARHTVAAIPAGRSREKLASELRTLCDVFERLQSSIRGKTAVTEVQIASARSKADALAAATKHPHGGDHLELTTEHRNAAFHRLVTHYNEVRRAIEFLRPRDVELERIVPSLYRRRSRAAVRRAA